MKYGRNYEQPTAMPMLTDAYNLPAKKVVHIVGPIVNYKLTPSLEKDLADCYRNTLDVYGEWSEECGVLLHFDGSIPFSE